MLTFEYKGYAADGQARRGLVEAADAKQARETLAADGVLAERVEPVGASSVRRGTFGGQPFGLAARADFYRELVALLQAGMPLVAALEMLMGTPELLPAKAILARARDRLKEGAPLAEALASAGPMVGEYERSVIAAGERAGHLDQVLDRLADFLEEQRRLRERIVTALIYPAIVVALALGIAFGLLGFVVPRFGQLLQQETRITLPLLTRLMLAAGRAFMTVGWPLLLVGAGALYYGWRRLRRDPERRIAFDRRCFRWPLFGHGYTLLVALRFVRTLILLLRGGVPLVEGLRLAGTATGSPWVSALAEREAEAIRHGAGLADAVRRIPPLAATLAGWIKVGETGGTLERLLDSAAARLHQQWERYLTRALTLLEPALIVLVGAFVLAVVLAILLPILELNKAFL